MKRLLLLFFVVGWLTCSSSAQKAKPLLYLNVETEKSNLTMPDGVSVASAAEIEKIRSELETHLKTMFELVPATDKRDCIGLGVVVEKLSARSGALFIGSTAMTVSKGEHDDLWTHNPVAEPTIDKFVSAVVFNVSSLVLRTQLGK